MKLEQGQLYVFLDDQIKKYVYVSSDLLDVFYVVGYYPEGDLFGERYTEQLNHYTTSDLDTNHIFRIADTKTVWIHSIDGVREIKIPKDLRFHESDNVIYYSKEEAIQELQQEIEDLKDEIIDLTNEVNKLKDN